MVQRAIIAAAVVCGVIAVLVTGTRAFDTNDDAAMAAIASGDFTGTPDGRLVFVMPAIGYPIAWLYRLVPSLPWYGLTFYAIHVVSLVVMSDVLWRRRKDIGPTALIGAAVLIAVQPRLLLALSFTTTAYVAAIASVVLLVDLATSENWKRHWVRASVVVVLAFVAGSMRSQPMWVVLLVASPVLLVLLVRCAKCVGLILVAVGFSVALNRLILQFIVDDAYRSFLAYNTLRGSLHGTPRVSAEALSAELLAGIGWTSIDRAMFQSFMFDDPGRFGYDTLQIVGRETDTFRPPFDVQTMWDLVFVRYPWLLVSLVVILVVAVLGRRWGSALLGCGIATVAGGLMVWAAWTARLPERVALPMWLALCVLACVANVVFPSKSYPDDAYWAAWTVRWRHGGRLAIAVAAWCLVLVVAVWRAQIGPGATSDFNATRAEALDSQLQLFRLDESVGVVLAYGSAITLESVDPLESRGVLADERILPFGWMTFSPMFETRKDRLEVDDSLRTILVRPDVVWLGNEAVTALYNEFLKQETAPAVPGLLVAQACPPIGGECLWRIQETDPLAG